MPHGRHGAKALQERTDRGPPGRTSREGRRLSDFRPTIVAFACNECCYAAADLAGISHFQYPANVLIVRVPCTGRVDLAHILRAFENGADGVIVGGCLEDQCHYVDGNIKARARVDFLKQVLEAIGLHPDRLRMEFISAAMGDRFAAVAKEMTERVRELGPVGVRRMEGATLEDKREYLRRALREISKGTGTELRGEIELRGDNPGFGMVLVNGEKCLACGACAFVCRDDSMKVFLEGEKFRVSRSHWRCRNCGACKEVCPGECIEIRPVMDLANFVEVDREVVVETEAARCERCHEIFAPEALRAHLGRIEPGDKIAVPTLCTRCRRFSEAERKARALGLGNTSN